jgi:hypothetical protein
MRFIPEQRQRAGESFLAQRFGYLNAGLAPADDHDSGMRIHRAPFNPEGSTLTIRKSHGKAVERVLRDQLTRQPAVRPAFGGDIGDHELFIIGRRLEFVQPFRLYVAVAGGTGAVAAALRLDAFEAGIHGRAHETLTGLEIQRHGAPIGL